MADKYWVGGSGTWNTINTHWSATSGGAVAGAVPTASDNVFFDQAGTYTVTILTTRNCLNFNLSAGTVTFSGGGLLIAGSMTVTNVTPTWTATGSITFTSTTTGNTVTSNGISFAGGITFGSAGGGGWTLGSALTCNSLNIQAGSFSTGNFNMTIANSLTTTAGLAHSLSLGSSSISIAGLSLATSSLTFNAGTSTITSSGSGIFDSLGNTFYNVVFNPATNGIIILPSSTTFNNLTLGTSGSFTQQYLQVNVGTTQTINGTLTTAGTDQSSRWQFLSYTPGTTYTISAAALSIPYADFQDCVATGAASWNGSSLSWGNLGGNTGITFTAAKTSYWNLAGTNQFFSNGWASSSGGTPAAANWPLAQDTAIIDNNSAGTSISGGTIGTLNCSSRTSAFSLDTGTLTVLGDLTLGSGITASANFSFQSRGTQTITSNGVTFAGTVYIGNQYGSAAITGKTQLGDAFISSDTVSGIFLNSGTFDTQSKNMTVSAQLASYSSSAPHAVILGSSTISLGGVVLNASIITGGTSTITLTGSGAQFSGTGFNTVILLASDIVSNFSVSANSITNAGVTTAQSWSIATTATVTANSLSLRGSAGKIVTITSNYSGAKFTFSVPSGLVACDYLSLKDSNATGGAAFYAGANSTNVSGNLGWAFSAAPASNTLTRLTSTGNFLTNMPLDEVNIKWFSGVNFTTPSAMGSGSGGTGNMYGIATNSANLFVSVGYVGANAAYATSSDGVTWIVPGTIGASGSNANNPRMLGVAVNNGTGLWVAVGYENTSGAPIFSTATTGSNWGTPTRINNSAAVAVMQAVAVSSTGLWVAVGQNTSNSSSVFSTSSSPSVATNWTTPATVGINQNLNGIAVNSAGLFVAVGTSTGGNPIVYTYNGSTWTAGSIGVTGAVLQAVAVNSAGLWVAVGQIGTNPAFSTSTNGTSWSTVATMNNASGLNVVMTSVAVNSAGLWVAVGYEVATSAPLYAKSIDGTNWTTPARMNSSAAAALMQGVAVNSTGSFAAVGYDSSNNGMAASSVFSYPQESTRSTGYFVSGQFDEVTNQGSTTKKRLTSTGQCLIAGTFDEVTGIS